VYCFISACFIIFNFILLNIAKYVLVLRCIWQFNCVLTRASSKWWIRNPECKPGFGTFGLEKILNSSLTKMITNIYAYKDNQMKNYPHIFKTGLNSTCEHLVLLSIFLNLKGRPLLRIFVTHIMNPTYLKTRTNSTVSKTRTFLYILIRKILSLCI